jgi:hypothetical protein
MPAAGAAHALRRRLVLGKRLSREMVRGSFPRTHTNSRNALEPHLVGTPSSCGLHRRASLASRPLLPPRWLGRVEWRRRRSALVRHLRARASSSPIRRGYFSLRHGQGVGKGPRRALEGLGIGDDRRGRPRPLSLVAGRKAAQRRRSTPACDLHWKKGKPERLRPGPQGRVFSFLDSRSRWRQMAIRILWRRVLILSALTNMTTGGSCILRS